MPVKVKELKEDTVVDIKVNKAFYLMVKGLSYYIFRNLPKETIEEDIKAVMSKKYNELETELQQHFYTTTLLLAEIERQAIANNMFDEKEILEPGDDGYVEPTQD